MDNHLKDILLSLSDAGVRYIVCGGVASVLHGVERMTLDLDISVDMDNDNLVNFLAALEKMDLKPRVPVPAESILDPEKRRIMIEEKNALVFTFIDPDRAYRQLDVFLKDEFDYHILIKDTRSIEIEKRKIYFLSRTQLINMKRRIIPQRDKDLLDIKALEEMDEKK